MEEAKEDRPRKLNCHQGRREERKNEKKAAAVGRLGSRNNKRERRLPLRFTTEHFTVLGAQNRFLCGSEMSIDELWVSEKIVKCSLG